MVDKCPLKVSVRYTCVSVVDKCPFKVSVYCRQCCNGLKLPLVRKLRVPSKIVFNVILL